MMEMHANWILPRAVTFAVMRWMVPPGGNVCVLQLSERRFEEEAGKYDTNIKGMFVGLVPAYVRECQASRYVAQFHHHSTWSQQLNKLWLRHYNWAYITRMLSLLIKELKHRARLFLTSLSTSPACVLPARGLAAPGLIQNESHPLKLKTVSNDCQVRSFVGCNKQEIEMTTSKYKQLNILSDTLTCSTWLTVLSSTVVMLAPTGEKGEAQIWLNLQKEWLKLLRANKVVYK